MNFERFCATTCLVELGFPNLERKEAEIFKFKMLNCLRPNTLKFFHNRHHRIQSLGLIRFSRPCYKQNSTKSTIKSILEMTEEIDKHILKKYEIQQKLGKGVRFVGLIRSKGDSLDYFSNDNFKFQCRLMV